MSPRRFPSVRDIAKATGFSKATVANALNGTQTVSAATAKKVRSVAARMGYERNPMVGAFMSAMRRSQGAAFRGVLAIVEIIEPDRPRHGPFHLELIRGCAACADELGFKVEFFQLAPSGVSPARLNAMLKARGIRGVILLPTWRSPDFSKFDWSYLTGVYTDYVTDPPVLNSVCCDHFRSVFEMMQQLRLRGYHRPGLVMESGRDDRVHFRIRAAVEAAPWAAPGIAPCRPLLSPAMNQADFLQWFEGERPDVVLSHDVGLVEWIKTSGRRVPEDVGFVAMNLAKVKHPCAALNLHPDHIGRCAVEILTAQIQRQAWGTPRHPTATMVIGEFADGPTVRPLPRARRRKAATSETKLSRR